MSLLAHIGDAIVKHRLHPTVCNKTRNVPNETGLPPTSPPDIAFELSQHGFPLISIAALRPPRPFGPMYAP